MGCDDMSIERAMFTAFKDRLQYNNLKYHIVFYSTDHGYEYNYETMKVRPFTSIVWLNVGTGEFDPFIKYLNNKCMSLMKQFEDCGYDDQDDGTAIGQFDNGYMIIDLNFLDDIIKNDGEYIISSGFLIEDVLNSFKYFCKTIKSSYDRDKSVFKEAIKKHPDVI